jgi:hypothetical protein
MAKLPMMKNIFLLMDTTWNKSYCHLKCNTLQSVRNVTAFKENLLHLSSGYILSNLLMITAGSSKTLVHFWETTWFTFHETVNTIVMAVRSSILKCQMQGQMLRYLFLTKANYLSIVLKSFMIQTYQGTETGWELRTYISLRYSPRRSFCLG